MIRKAYFCRLLKLSAQRHLAISKIVMGNQQGSTSTGNESNSTTIMSAPSEEHTVKLQHPGSCTGMYWRGDPFTGKSAPSNDNWPRNGALLRGTGPYDARGEQYFKVTAVQQAGTEGFKPVPEGTWMLYNQGGLLLHKV